MYLYILSLHSGTQPAAEPELSARAYVTPRDPVRIEIETHTNMMPSVRTGGGPIPSWDLRGGVPIGQSAPTKKETETLAVRLWYSKDEFDVKALEKVMKDAYTFGFGTFAQLEAPKDKFSYTSTINYVKPEIYNRSAFHFRATRIELPDGMGQTAAEEHLLSFWDVSGATYSLRPNDGPHSGIENDGQITSIPYMVPPKELRTLEDIHRFADYVASLNAVEKAKKAWSGGICSVETINGKEAECGLAYDAESFYNESASYHDNTLKKHLEKIDNKHRAVILKRASSGEPVKKVLLPCDITPWFGTSLLPEFKVVKSVSWTPGVGCLEEATLAALLEGLRMVSGSAPTLTPAIQSNIKPVKQAVKAPEAPKFLHQEDLDVLWDIFTHEYIQRPKRKGGLTTSPIPNSILLAVWKHIALQPKEVTLFGNPKYENSIIRKKDLPKHWTRVITPEVLTEYFYAKGETFKDCILYSFYNRAFLNTLFSFYNLEIAVNDELDWSAVPPIDPTPILLALTNPDGLTEDHKKAWIAKFVKERMDMKEKAVAGSQETYSEFISWVRNGYHIGVPTHKVSGELRDKFISQFPQAEFTRLMKENGLTMTRRSRGMVYVGASLRSKPDDDWVERTPAEGEILPLESANATAATAETDMIEGAGANEENWETL